MRKALYILGDLDDADIRWLAAAGKRRSLVAGQAFVRAGVSPDALFIVLDGDCAVRAGDGAIVARLGAGDIVGEMSLIEKRPPNVSVVAVTDGHVLALPQTALRQRLAADTGFAARFYRALAVFLSDRLRASVAQLGYGQADDDKQATFESEHELDEGVLDTVHLAGERMRRLLALLAGGGEAAR